LPAAAAELLPCEAPAPVVGARGVPMHEPPEHARGRARTGRNAGRAATELGILAPPAQPPAAGAASDAAQAEVTTAVTAAAASDVPDAANWDAMAEEIRMQVLQRIDMFTDTGLRTQLGERLQPIVDRASADLVATINQHVGELLRALCGGGHRARNRQLAAQPLILAARARRAPVLD
jgi:hypothetical protein